MFSIIKKRFEEYELEINTLVQLKRELESFKLLTTANMVGAAVTIAYSITILLTNIIPLITGNQFEPIHLPYLLIVISGFATAISWITRSARLNEEHDEIIKELTNIINEIKSNTSRKYDIDEKALGIIVKSLAFYRENNEKINRLKWRGRLTGAFTLVTGIPPLVTFLSGAYPVDNMYLLAQGFVVVFSIGVSIAAWYVPVIIKRFMDTWDYRLKLVEDANKKLSRILEDN